ncbi:tRNA pseudouridine(38-40) synthase TruA [Metabacillus sp. RGM 3146]|uniref:tRNA pseudouridine(38-40) synthase TruA n=1 Tax=Metabacillus sp. RGM 3146 TaxID=3401092 RepID=UPI003B9A2CB2
MRLKCKISYDGTGFSGYQVQPGKRTVQGEVEKALSVLHKNKPVKVTASGRTDAGVHAAGQIIHFDTELSIPMERWPKALCSLLPEDIVLSEAEEVPADFHARFDVKQKEYRYMINRAIMPNVFTRNQAYHYPYTLNISSMEEAGKLLTGTHDFTSFCSAKTEVEDRVRTIYQFEILEEGDLLIFRFAGSGFLYNMVRILTGTLLDAGRGVIKPEAIPAIMEAKDRNRSGKTAPAHGLYLWRVDYDN